MKLKLSFSILPIVLATTAVAGTSPIITNTPTQCVVGGVSCPTGSICTQTMTCGGLCLSIFTPPPVIPCTDIGKASGCPTGSTCTPTMVCTAENNCSGQCISTPGPSIACETSASNNCPTGSSCTIINTCYPGYPFCKGQCMPTQAPLPSVPCILDGPSVCGTNSDCTQTEVCSGQCLGTFVPPPPTSSTNPSRPTSSTHRPTSTHHSRPTYSRHHHKGDHNDNDDNHK